jgi:diaminopimelate epimerase
VRHLQAERTAEIAGQRLLNSGFMPAIPFIKASACGNDFLIVAIEHAPANIAEFTRRICDRRNGVGADGVEWLLPPIDADVAIRLINADGSNAEISGNGTRCVAAWFCTQHQRDSVVIRTDAGIKTCELMARVGQTFEFRTSMGQPLVRGNRDVELNGKVFRGVEVSMGNPHFVIFVSGFEPGWQSWSEELSVHPDFPQGTNVELVRVFNEHEIEVRFCERGVGETNSSGTGSSASAVAAIHSARVKSPVRVLAPGGAQSVEWGKELLLYGPATILCRGEFFI